MERLTHKYDGQQDALYKREHGDSCVDISPNFIRMSEIQDILNHLAAYEDTGLMPDEIERILDAYGRGMTLRTENAQRLEIIKHISTERLAEIVEAEKQHKW